MWEVRNYSIFESMNLSCDKAVKLLNLNSHINMKQYLRRLKTDIHLYFDAIFLIPYPKLLIVKYIFFGILTLQSVLP